MKTAPTPIPAYLHPDTARQLLAVSRARIARKRVERRAADDLQICGWAPEAARDLSEIYADIVLGEASR